ncbi:MAG: hypothetical protein R2830_14265 [Saprospiraceae bacterium]
MRHLYIFLAVFSILYLLACTSEASTSRPLNPNGDSELALLMRAMFEDGMKVKAQIQHGEKPTISVDFMKIYEAKPTDPVKMKPAEFKVLAQSYLQAVQALQAAAPGQVKGLYKGMVITCINCHNTICPGPKAKIKQLYL